MNTISRGLAVTAGVVALFAAPAFAGVTGTEGGTTTITTNETNTYTNRTVSSNVEYLSNIINDRGNRTTQYNIMQSWSTQYYPVNGRSHGYAEWSTYDGSSSPWYTFLQTTYQQTADNKVGEYYTQVGTTYDRTESDQNIVASTNLIVIGDSDALASQFTAQGTRDVTLNIENFYWNDLNRTDVRQKTFDMYQDQQYNRVDYYTSHIQYVSYVSPIVLDLKGSGKLMASNGNWLPHKEFMKDRLAIFDFYGSGDPVVMEWVGAEDGLLCAPKNGKVDGTSLFGIANGFADGYEELQVTRDKNRDGKVSGAELEGLSVWQDANGNAIAERGELKTVQELGISEISVEHKNYKSSFVMNGKQQASFDWWPSVRGLRKMTPPKQG